MGTAAPRTPGFADILVLGVLGIASTLAVRLGDGPVIIGSAPVAVAAAAAWTLMLGLPALAFTYERAHTTLAWMLPLGALAGALPLPALAVSGLLGLRLRSGDWESALWALERGVPIPGAGVIFWARTLRLELVAMLVGLTCALMFWLIMVRARQANPAINVLLALFAYGTLVTGVGLLR
jgi:hypothetical protein